eukprot:6574063-Pyramimonas_sp.AAC.1
MSPDALAVWKEHIRAKKGCIIRRGATMRDLASYPMGPRQGAPTPEVPRRLLGATGRDPPDSRDNFGWATS